MTGAEILKLIFESAINASAGELAKVGIDLLTRMS